jgi:hypothetical protein
MKIYIVVEEAGTKFMAESHIRHFACSANHIRLSAVGHGARDK